MAIADILLIAAGIILLLAGLLGTVLPVLPGPPLAWGALLAGSFVSTSGITARILVIAGAAAIAVTVADNVFPALITKKSGGTKAGVIGATVGLLAGICFSPIGIILGVLLGAFIGELIHDSGNLNRAVKSALGSVAGFLLGAGLKIITVGIFAWVFFSKIAIFPNP